MRLGSKTLSIPQLDWNHEPIDSLARKKLVKLKTAQTLFFHIMEEG